jgi:hypothetical protein
MPIGECGDDRGPGAGHAVAEQGYDVGRDLGDDSVEVGGGPTLGGAHAGQMAGPARLAKAGDGVIVAVPDNIGRSDREPQPAGLRRPARLVRDHARAGGAGQPAAAAREVSVMTNPRVLLATLSVRASAKGRRPAVPVRLARQGAPGRLRGPAQQVGQPDLGRVPVRARAARCGPEGVNRERHRTVQSPAASSDRRSSPSSGDSVP